MYHVPDQQTSPMVLYKHAHLIVVACFSNFNEKNYFFENVMYFVLVPG
jgi:hypothetical protein